MIEERADPRATGLAVKLRIAGVVLVNVALAFGAASALTWLATRPGLRQRVDLTAARINTLDESSREVLRNVPEGPPIQVDVFFRPLEAQLYEIGLQAQDRTLFLLDLMQTFAPDLVRVKEHQLSLDPESRAPLEARMRELGVSDLNVVVVSRGARREVVSLLGDIAEVDLGNPIQRPGVYRPPSLSAFRGEEALVRAVLKVTQESSPRALFSWGQGELDLYAEEPQDLAQLQTALEADGFRTARWVPDEDGAVPADCDVLAILAPQEPFDARARGWIQDYLDRGGRLVIAPYYRDPDGPGSVADVLAAVGVLLEPGYVCRPIRDDAGAVVTGRPECAALVLRASQMAAQHPITRPLRMGDRSVRLALCQPLARGQRPSGGALLDILAADEYTWADRSPTDWVPQESEVQGPFALAMTSVYTPPSTGPMPQAVGEGAARAETRVFAIGTADVFANSIFAYNSSFALNVFNWAASREYRVNVATRDPDFRRLDLQGSGPSTVRRVALWILPAVCVALGLFTFWRRRR